MEFAFKDGRITSKVLLVMSLIVVQRDYGRILTHSLTHVYCIICVNFSIKTNTLRNAYLRGERFAGNRACMHACRDGLIKGRNNFAD